MAKQITFEPVDSLKQPGADEIAERIRDYWHKRGYLVNVWIEMARANGAVTCFIRSDLLNGCPRARTKMLEAA